MNNNLHPDYSHLQNHAMYKGMVKVLPSGPSQSLSSLRRDKAQFASTPDLSLVSSRQLHYPATPQSAIPRLPPPTKSPKPRLPVKSGTPTTGTASLQNGNIFPTQFTNGNVIQPPAPFTNGNARAPQVLSMKGHAGLPPGPPTQQFMSPPTVRAVVPPLNSLSIPLKQTSKTNGVVRDNGFDMQKLHDEMAQLRLELLAMNKQMEEDDVWLRFQSEQVKELAEQQQQLQSSMSIISQPPPSNPPQEARITAPPPPIPATTRPMMQQPIGRTPTISSSKPTAVAPVHTQPKFTEDEQVVKRNMNNAESKVVVNGVDEIIETRTNTSKSTYSATPSNSAKVTRESEAKENRHSLPSLPSSSPISRDQGRRLSSVNVKRISGLFESSAMSSEVATHNTSNNKYDRASQHRQVCGPSVADKLKLLSSKSATLPTFTREKAANANISSGKTQDDTNIIHNDKNTVNDDSCVQQTRPSKPVVSAKPTQARPASSEYVPPTPPLSPRPPPSPKPTHGRKASHVQSQKFNSLAQSLEASMGSRMVPPPPPSPSLKPFISSSSFSSANELPNGNQIKPDVTVHPQPSSEIIPEAALKVESNSPPPVEMDMSESPYQSLPETQSTPQHPPELRETQLQPPAEKEIVSQSTPSLSEEHNHVASTPPPPPPLPPSTPFSPPELHDNHIQSPKKLAENNNEDRLSISSMASSSSFHSARTNSLNGDSADIDSGKATLMEEIRKFGQSGQALKRTISEEVSNRKSRMQENSMQGALQSRFQAFCGQGDDSDSGGDMIDGDDDSDNWED